VASRESAGQPLHVFSRTGEWERSFGLDVPVLRPDLSLIHWRWLVPAGTDGFWAGALNEYRLEQWSAAGETRNTLVMERAWFPPWYSPQEVEPAPTRPPAPLVLGIQLDDNGLLWVLASHAHEHWAEALDRSVYVMGFPRIRDDRQYTVPVLEVLDPRTGTLLARHRFSTHGISLAGPNAAVRTWIDQNELPRAEIIPLSLRGWPADP
jgi:hypothetical protein